MSSFKFVATLVIAFAALPAHQSRAQGTPSSAAAPNGVRDPGDPKAVVPPTTYASAFRSYRPNADVEPGAWRDLNENVGRIGGWRVYGREASPDTGVPPQPAGHGNTEGVPPAAKPAHGHTHQGER